ncbi:guanylate kinase [Caldalkalibacillus uzonensis]|uniref:Guanylate kinase n=1 Tax=Caldalkalibacillus uzonensis TaxID=353224 RepID=A0ABU0CNF1_9BACI|nr:guanylate kinase [Caldalkalibacillus uzonensis]MDQ0337934.1 guanylate kinase [Caldalkalibacillus uzonensis]
MPLEGRALLFVGPDGSGRFTLANAIGVTLNIPMVTSYTTRPKRPRETDGKEYHFVSEDKFKAMQEANEFIEVVQSDDFYYGIRKEDCQQLLEKAGSFFAILSPEGCEIFKREFTNTLTIFVYADRDTVVQRQIERGDDPETIKRHLSHYEEIMAYKDKCDIAIPNYDLASTAQELTNRIEKFLGIEHHPDSKY